MKDENQPFLIIDLIRKFQRGTISSEEHKVLYNWVHENKANTELFEQLNSEGYRSDALSRFNRYDTEAAWERVNDRLQQIEVPGRKHSGKIRTLMVRIAGAAAILILVSLLFINREKLSDLLNPVHQQLVNTKTGERKVIQLPDGSKVWLSSASTLSFPERFRGRYREINLKGEAFFEVTKDKTHPFLIHSGSMLTRVVGTSFNIHAYNDQKVATVTVLTGIVSVSELTATRQVMQEVRVKPFEQAILNKVNHTVAAQQYPNAKDLLLRRQGIFHYAGTPVLQIIEDVRKNYNINIQVAGDLNSCTFYGDLSPQDDIYKFLRRVCLTINAAIERNGNTIIITGNGC